MLKFAAGLFAGAIVMFVAFGLCFVSRLAEDDARRKESEEPDYDD